MQQNGKDFLTNAEKMETCIGVNYIMAVNQLPRIQIYWDHDNFVGYIGIQNIFTRTRYQILKAFTLLRRQNKTKQIKAIKLDQSLIDHLNESFQAVFSNEHEQSIDERMTKFKKHSSLRQ